MVFLYIIAFPSRWIRVWNSMLYGTTLDMGNNADDPTIRLNIMLRDVTYVSIYVNNRSSYAPCMR